jgi:carbamoyl-phosphate synthase large subunit
VSEICRTQQIRVVVPTIDTELSFYAQNRERFANIGTTVLISAPEVIELTNDKRNTHAWLRREGLPTVRQAAAEEVLSDPRDWAFPLITKPPGGSSSVGVKVVQNLEQLRSALDGTDCLVQTLAPGKEYTVDFLADEDGKCICAIPRLRLETRGGEMSKGVTMKCRPVIELTEHLCTRLPGPYGVLNVQMFWEQDTGELNVIEINPRFGGGYPLSWEAGGKYPQWIIEEILKIPTTASGDGWRDRLLMLRYDESIFVDAAEAGL